MIIGKPDVYGKEDIILFEGKRWLPIKLGGRRFGLPLVNVGDNQSKAIAFFIPDPNINYELALASSKEMAGLLEKMKPRIVIKEPSTKSGLFIDTAIAILHKKPQKVIQLIGGESADEVKHITGDVAVAYVPVTRLATGKAKYVGIMPEDRRAIAKLTPDGYGLTIAEDVYSTGATVRATAELLGIEHFYIATIARESEFDSSYPPPLAKNMRAILYLPEILGFEANELYSIADRISIPPAIVFN